MTPHHRRTPTDRRPAVPPGPHEHDGAPHPGPPGVEPVVGRRRGDDIDERELPVSASVRVWRPRAAEPEELDDARAVLVVHRLDPRTGRCAACAADCPCPPALDAGRALAEAGAWNTVPFTGSAGWRADRAPVRAKAGWAARLVRRLSWTAAAE
jgi:hypothetical protein